MLGSLMLLSRSLAALIPALSFVALVSLVAACGERSSPTGSTPPQATSAVTAATSATSAASAAPVGPDPARGAKLVTQFECARCHDGVPGAPPRPAMAAETQPDSKHCVHCHQAIRDGHFRAPRAEATQRWRKNVELLCDVPSLAGVGRLQRGWVEGFLLRPVDLRPRLAPSMPRLELTPEQARDIAAFLVPEAGPSAAAPVASLERGEALFEERGCMSCHLYSGALPPPPAGKGRPDERGISVAMRLAPDLRHARARMTPPVVAAWLRDPRSIKPDTLMPAVPLNEDEIAALVRFVLTAPLAPVEPPVRPARLPVLARKVHYEEVKQRVFNKVCWHCHSDADYAIGDGGPGNTGGFGFRPRGLNLGAYEGIASGSLDDEDERRSVFEPMADGSPRLLASLLARQAEEAGGEGALRGMPLGLPALSPEEIQLVESWVAQGHLPD